MLQLIPKPFLLVTQTVFAATVGLYNSAVETLDTLIPRLDPSINFDADTDWFGDEDDYL